MGTRQRLPNRRIAETFELEVSGLRYTVTVGRHTDGRPAEVFLQNHRPGSQSDANARDAAVAASLATAANKPAQATKLVIFMERCEARAILYAACEFDLHEAVDVLQAHAIASGLVDEIGQDAAQAIISEAFARIR
jgi:hypothetical protein